MITQKKTKRTIIIGILFVVIVAIGILKTIKVIGAANIDANISNTAYETTMLCGERYHISPEILQALIETESGGDPKAQNGDCKGLCQIYEKYHYARMAKLDAWDLYDEQSNILIAADYLAELFAEYGDICLVLDIYNGNSKALKNYEAGIVSEYAGKILKRSAELERLHGK